MSKLKRKQFTALFLAMLVVVTMFVGCTAKTKKGNGRNANARKFGVSIEDLRKADQSKKAEGDK